MVRTTIICSEDWLLLFYPFPLLQVSSLIAGLSRSSFTKTDWSCLSCFQANPVPGVQKPHPLCECPQPLWRSLFSCFTISHGLLPSISCVTKYLYFSMLRFFFPWLESDWYWSWPQGFGARLRGQWVRWLRGAMDSLEWSHGHRSCLHSGDTSHHRVYLMVISDYLVTSQLCALGSQVFTSKSLRNIRP